MRLLPPMPGVQSILAEDSMPRLHTPALILNAAVSSPVLAQHRPWGRGDSQLGPSRWNTPRAEARRNPVSGDKCWGDKRSGGKAGGFAVRGLSGAA